MVIFEGKTKAGERYKIRNLEGTDTKSLMDYINVLSAERTFILRQGEVITLEDEERFVASQLEAVSRKKAVHLVVECNGAVVGASQINLKNGVHCHVGHLGISLLAGYRDQGIGTTLLRISLDEARRRLDGIRIVDLTVFAVNNRAMHLYTKLGFREFGRLPKAISYNGAYVDEVYMYMDLSK